MSKNFAVLILTNRRPDKVKTYNTLKRLNYTGRIIFVLDDQDTTLEQYKKNYTDVEYAIFDKLKYHELTDTAENTKNLKAVVYARNATFDIAKEYGLDYFLVLDDDYTAFNYSFMHTEHGFSYLNKKVKINLNRVFKSFITFLENTSAKCIAFAQGGDFIGGQSGGFGKKIFLDRKCMNSFFCKTDRPFQFYGLINEDVTMYTQNAKIGDLYFTHNLVRLEQTQTQANSGGLTTIYLEQGTYLKSFYSVLYCPSSVKVQAMRTEHTRLHHMVKRETTYPKIIEQKYKKASNGK